MQLPDKKWFTEICPSHGCAFSLAINAHLHHEKSDFQTIDVYATTQFGNLLVLDGCTMLSERENFIYHEMLTHPALFSHPAPRRVAIIGGGDCGTLREVLTHPTVEQAWQIEIDERVTRVSEEYFPELCERNHDPRANLMFDDGVAWIRAAADDSLDVLIVDSTDPVGPAEGLFGADFYQQCRRVLGQTGLLVQQSESPLLHLDIHQRMDTALVKSGFGHRQSLLFPQCIYPSGWWSATLACANPIIPNYQQATAAELPTQYYTSAMHQAALTLPPFFAKGLNR